MQTKPSFILRGPEHVILEVYVAHWVDEPDEPILHKDMARRISTSRKKIKRADLQKILNETVEEYRQDHPNLNISDVDSTICGHVYRYYQEDGQGYLAPTYEILLGTPLETV